ncbi:MAG TPA: carboxypeptidase regulatory-like domain-containing protein [Candidatus Baltobacteraceae bacterium]|nr:carboxypeptidase regulatory-like domain-containing protein [Candidatus Baltobacteraceae bacterium]
MGVTRLRTFVGVLVLALAVLFCGRLNAGVTASISGTVTDASGAAVAGATVTATNVETGIKATQNTNGQGYYSFQSLPLGKYTIEVQQKGFKVYQKTGVVLDVNDALVVDAVLQVGQSTEKVVVQSDALHVETSNTQMGEVIEGKQMTDVPLVTRSYTDLLALQPGVVSAPSGMTGAFAGPFISAGFPAPLVSGDENAGGLSVNGMREANNGFILNGILVKETGYGGAGAIPNLDSIGEFRILTNNYDAEYGNYSGGQINVVTKSGTNDWHGNAFEFLRNTSFDAANFFDAGHRGAYHQNQFGGTFGGPVKRDKIFFFADYQGNRKTQAATQTIHGAPSAATIQGNLSGIAPSLEGSTVNGAAWAQQLTNQFASSTGQTVQSGEAYYSPTCVTTDVTLANHCVLPGGILPTTAFSPIASNLLKFIQPAAAGTIDPALGTGTFSTNSGKQNLNDNKFSGRVDANTGFGLLTGYYYFDRYDRADPYWASNAPLYPGFSADSKGQTHTIALGDTKTFGASSVNEFRLGYYRLNALFNQPLGGSGVTLASLGFAPGDGGAPGIHVGTPSVEGIPEIDFNNFAIGVPSRPNQLVQNIYQVLDNFSMVVGTHTLKFGGQYHYNQNEENLSNVANGNFFFGTGLVGGATETGNDFVDFLLGAPSTYIQGQSYPSYGRSFYFGLFAQDSWRIKSNLTFNYGLRYDVSSPWHEKYNEIQTLIPGQQSLSFPGSPIGWVFPGDTGVPSTLAPTRWDKFAPRLGLAYSFGDHEGTLGKILGKPGSTSIRVGWGMFYTSFEGATDYNQIGDAPFGNYATQVGSTFASPFIPRASGNCLPNPMCTNLFPAPAPVKGFSAKNPASGFPYDNLTEWLSAYGTISSSPAIYPKNQVPYAENYELSIQRQITPSDLLTVSYVGTQGHKLIASVSANPGNPATCLALLAAGCGPGGENGIYTLNGVTTAGTRGPFDAPYQHTPVNGVFVVPFGNDSYFITGGYSSYNSAQINWRHTSGRLQTLLGYTFSKSLDISSGYGEQYNPVNPRLSRGLSAFDSTHNFVLSYSYNLPFDKLEGPKKLTNGWQVSGITRFATGLPVTIVDNSDFSLLGTQTGGPITLGVDTPNLVGPVHITDPRKTGGFYFSSSAFGPTATNPSEFGQEGTANRRFFHGPGINNWDMALLKSTQLTERFNLQFRAELYNVFNHAQFLTPSGIITYSPTTFQPNPNTMGQVPGTTLGRIGQLSLKLNF